ncbi:hypothetical protein [Desulfovibrio piger]|uniref:hypothetical protein n=1 Tax=Desulfovibrio piger TaxID=901 RepID=UPI0039F60316
MDPATLTAISIASTVASTGMGVMSSIQQGKARQAQAEYQADVARQNQQLAEQQASAQRKEGYDNMIAKRQETAKLIGRQRAAAGASGATVDVGSSLDLQADTAAQGEIDALNIYNQASDKAYGTQLQGWGYGQQAAGYDAQADAAGSSIWSDAAGTALGASRRSGAPGGNMPRWTAARRVAGSTMVRITWTAQARSLMCGRAPAR